MPLPSFLRSKASTAPRDEGAADDAGPVRDARLRARQRLIGAVVLLAAGLVVFPLLFESEPRPLPVDIPIVAIRKEGAATASVAPPPKPRAVTVAPPPDAGNETPARAVATSEPTPPVRAALPAAPTPVPAPVPTAVPTRVPTPAPTPAPRAASVPVPSAARVPAPAAKTAVTTAAKPTASAPPAASVPAASAPSGRFVVQVGAYTDATALREARAKVEKLGLKTYTQVVETPSGSRTRVRIGPFETRDEADRASAHLKAAGLPAYILAL